MSTGTATATATAARRTRTRGRLRVAVPAPLAAVRRGTGHGNMWQHVLARLRQHADVATLDPSGRRRLRRPSVWLADGHQRPLPVREPVVVQVHEAGWSTPELRATLDPGFLAVIDRNTALTVTGAAAVITPSRSSARQVVERYGVAPDRVHAVPHGVDHAVFRPDAGPADGVLRRAGADPSRPYVLFAASLHPRKNLAAVRAAVDDLAGRGFPHQLVVVAAPPPNRRDADDLAAAAAAPLPLSGAPVTHVLDPSDGELARLMAGAAALCLPSLMEGFGMTVLEAMACGAPVVVSDRGALPEVVGDAGIVVAPAAPAVAEGLARVLGDESCAASLRAAGLERAAGFTWSRTAAGWYAVLAAVGGNG